MGRTFKKIVKIGLIIFLLLCAAVGVLYWRLTHITITPAETAALPSFTTFETDRFKIALPDDFVEERRTSALEWPDGRIDFLQRVFESQEAADRHRQHWNSLKDPKEIKEDVSGLMGGRPATLASSRDTLCHSADSTAGQEAVLCPYFSLKIYYPKGFLLFTQKSGWDYRPIRVEDRDQRDAQVAAKKEEFLRRVNEFLPSFTWLEEADPPEGVAGYRAGPGFIARTGTEDYLYNVTHINFNSPELGLGFYLSSRLAGPDGRLQPDLPHRLEVLWQVIDQAILENKLPWPLRGFNHYPLQAASLEGYEFVSVAPYFSKKYDSFMFVWQETTDKPADPVHYNLELSMYDDFTNRKPVSPEELSERMALWREIQKSIQIKNLVPNSSSDANLK